MPLRTISQLPVQNDLNGVEVLQKGLVNEIIVAEDVSQHDTSTEVTSSAYFDTSIPALGEKQEVFNFTNLELACPIDADEISNRWLKTYLPSPEQITKTYSSGVMTFMFRMLKSYAATAVHGRGTPPFLHFSQINTLATTPQLATCLSLVRLCDKKLPGSESAVTGVLRQEMTRLYEARKTCDNMALLATFQAYLIYSMVVFFYTDYESRPFLREAMMNLQELASASSRQGLVCVSEQEFTRPKWECWIVAEAKRRTLYTMYMFDSVLSAQDGLPSYLSVELTGLAAPGSKALWQAQTRNKWHHLYNTQLAEWSEGYLRIEELWPIPSNLSESELAKWRGRVDRWLETVDEYGTMLFAVTSCTHGG